MSARNSNNFFNAHWDWLALGAGLALLAASVVFNFVLRGEDADYSATLPPQTGAKVEKVDMAPYTFSTNGFVNTHHLVPVDGEKASFLATGLRVYCAPGDPAVKGCGRPIVFGVEKCPFCGADQKSEKPTEDHDGDGLPDTYEKEHGLDPLNPDDASEDKDGDGFSNMDEFKAGTNPSDPVSHPDYLPFLKLSPDVKQKYTQLTFVKVAYKTPDGRVKIEFKDPAFAKDYSRGVFAVFAGDEIGKTGFKLKGYEEKSKKVKIAGGMERVDDISEATVVRIADKKEIKLVKGITKTPTDVEATIIFDLIAGKGVQSFPVTAGKEFNVQGCRYRVDDLIRENGKYAVKVTSLANNETRIIH